MSMDCIKREHDHSAHNYHPLPVVFASADGCMVKDPEGKEYYDFLSAYSAVNQGHCCPAIIDAMIEQSKKLTLSSRAFYNDKLGEFAKYITEFFNFDMVLPMNSGAEAVETAIKLARAWGYQKKGIPANEAIIISCKGNFHGRSTAIISMSQDPDCREGFGPFVPGLEGHSVEYNNVEALKTALESHGKKVAAFLCEPIQGEAGIVCPDDGYLTACKKLCEEHNCLFIADEIQSGLARTGRMLAVDHDGVKPDVLILGKALSGGVYPVSAVLANKEIMLCFAPGSHGSTYGGNPVACAVAMAALKELKDKKLAERADELGQRFRKALVDMKCKYITEVRGKGLLNAIVIDDKAMDPTGKKKAWHLCLLLADRGLLCKPTHDHIIRLAPPLVITAEQLDDCVEIIRKALADLPSMNIEDIPRHEL